MPLPPYDSFSLLESEGQDQDRQKAEASIGELEIKLLLMLETVWYCPKYYHLTGAQTLDRKVDSLIIYQLSYPGLVKL